MPDASQPKRPVPAEIHRSTSGGKRNVGAARADSPGMPSLSHSNSAFPAPVSSEQSAEGLEDAALKDAALALADSATLFEMARDHLRSNPRGLPRSQVLSRLRQSKLTGHDAIQYLDGVQLEAAFARSRVRQRFPEATTPLPPQDADRARRRSAAIAARLLLFSPASPPEAAPIPAPAPVRKAAREQPASFVALDFETATNRRDSACAIGAVLIEDGRITARVQTLLRPPWLHVDPRNEGIHGISARQLNRAPKFAQAYQDLDALFSRADFIVAHNAGFDRTVLEASCRTARIRPTTLPWVCTVQLARKAFPLSSHRLPVVAAHLGIALHHHDAASDAETCALIALHIAEHQPKVFRAATRAFNGQRRQSAFAAPVTAR